MSAVWTWFGLTKPLFVNKKGLKVSAENFRKHLKKELFHTINKIYPRKDWIFIPDSVTSHTSNLVRDFLKGMIAQSYIKKDKRPPKLQRNNLLDYYFWHKVKTKKSIWKQTKHPFWKHLLLFQNGCLVCLHIFSYTLWFQKLSRFRRNPPQNR